MSVLTASHEVSILGRVHGSGHPRDRRAGGTRRSLLLPAAAVTATLRGQSGQVC